MLSSPREHYVVNSPGWHPDPPVLMKRVGLLLSQVPLSGMIRCTGLWRDHIA